LHLTQVSRRTQVSKMGAEDEELEQTLIVCREAALYKIAPRTSGGHRSGDWLVSDRIFAGRVRVIAKGQLAEVRIEDPNR